MQIFDFIICVIFDNMFNIFKNPDENKPFLGLLGLSLTFMFVCLFVILAFLPKRYPSLYFSLCNLVIFSREYCRKWRKINVLNSATVALIAFLLAGN